MREGRLWHVIYTKPRQENKAQTNIERKGFPVFFPRLHIHRTVKPVALFPCYIFVFFHPIEEHRFIIYNPGVKSIIDTIDGAVIQELRKRAGDQGVIEYQSRLVPGQEVRITSGSFADQVGIVLSEPDSQARVKILLTLMGRQIKIAVPLDKVDTYTK